MPNEIFVLGLNAGEIAVYAYLLFCEDRVTFQCWPSCRSIGRATGMSVNTVRKYIRSLEAKGLITTEPTTITDRHGRKRNGNLLFTIRPITEAMEQYYEEQLRSQPKRPA
nr:helix-turn-helix domain-containing protein [Hydrogenoanaerobacterium saccharovorans]